MTRQELEIMQEAQAILEPIAPEVVEKAIQSTVYITSSGRCDAPFAQVSEGMGVHIGNGKVITVHHLLGVSPETSTITVQTCKSSAVEQAQLICANASLDFAVIALSNQKTFPAASTLSDQSLVAGNTLFVIGGYPYRYKPLPFRVLCWGDYRNLDPYNRANRRSSFVFFDNIDDSVNDAIIRNGNSGGGVFATDGGLVGILYGGVRRNNSVLAHRSDTIQHMIQGIKLS